MYANEIVGPILEEWKRQAEKDGLLDEYEYHLSMVYPPLPYGQWKIKYHSLERIQNSPQYMDGRLSESTYKRETQLCNELGY